MMAQPNEQNTAKLSSNPMVILIDACKTNDVSLMERALELASQPNSRHSVQDVLQRGLKRAAARNATSVLTYVLDRGVDVATLDAEEMMTSDVLIKPSLEVLETLIAHGWDINTRGPYGAFFPLLWYVVEYPDLVRWCLDHGAVVAIPEEPPQVNADGVRSYTGRSGESGLTILGVAASCGTPETFELLRSRGAPLDPLALHYAVNQATINAPKEGSDPSAADISCMDMVRYFVDDVKLDVNAVKHQVGIPCTTPLCFVARRGMTGQDYRDLVFLLLDHGADLNLGLHHWPNPVACAESSGNSNFLQAVEEWKARNGNNKTD
jgi:hypothetical protein